MASGEPRTTGHMCQDLENIAAWIKATREVMSHLDQGISVSGGIWDPPVVDPVRPPPIALPRCVLPWTSVRPPVSIADLVQTLANLQNWVDGLRETLECLPGDTPIPPPEP
jgi:hypothetical protein